MGKFPSFTVCCDDVFFSRSYYTFAWNMELFLRLKFSIRDISSAGYTLEFEQRNILLLKYWIALVLKMGMFPCFTIF